MKVIPKEYIPYPEVEITNELPRVYELEAAGQFDEEDPRNDKLSKLDDCFRGSMFQGGD